jgi:tRNA pseudouridine38-40 synthase
MPSLGLMLEHPVFDSYNAKVSKINENLQPCDPDYRPPIDFDLYQNTIELFKQEHIYTKMRAIEDQHGMSVADQVLNQDIDIDIDPQL